MSAMWRLLRHLLPVGQWGQRWACVMLWCLIRFRFPICISIWLDHQKIVNSTCTAVHRISCGPKAAGSSGWSPLGVNRRTSRPKINKPISGHAICHSSFWLHHLNMILWFLACPLFAHVIYQSHTKTNKKMLFFILLGWLGIIGISIGYFEDDNKPNHNFCFIFILQS